MLTESKISVLLGRPLSSTETTNFDTYLTLAKSKVADIIGSRICSSSDTKNFTSRYGYRTLNTPIFSYIDLITVDGVELTTDDYTAYQGSDMNGTWFNSIVFETEPTGTIVIEASWGFSCLPLDVQMMIAEQFAIASSTNLSDALINSKKVEDFSISFNNTSIQQAFVEKYMTSINKYNSGSKGNIQSGEVCLGYDYVRRIL